MTKPIRQIRIEGNIAYVPLTKGYEAIIDASDVHLVDGLNWYACERRATVYAQRAITMMGRVTTVMMHRIVMDAPVGLLVDHADRNGLNNRKQNLRIATNSQNQMNQGIRSNNSSGCKGVTFAKTSGFKAQIEVNGTIYYLGTFLTLGESSAAYADASKKLHGDFGRVS